MLLRHPPRALEVLSRSHPIGTPLKSPDRHCLERAAKTVIAAMESLGSSWRLCLQLQNNAFVDDLLKAVASSPMSKSTLISINCGLDLHFRFFPPEIHLSTCHHLHSFKLYHPLYAIRHDYDPVHLQLPTRLEVTLSSGPGLVLVGFGFPGMGTWTCWFWCFQASLDFFIVAVLGRSSHKHPTHVSCYWSTSSINLSCWMIFS